VTGEPPKSQAPAKAQSPSKSEAPQRVLIVTGMSGAGRSTALKMLEDMGYEAVDNLPLGLLPPLIRGAALTHPLAVGIDVRTRDFSSEHFLEALGPIEAREGVALAILFLDCEDELLRQRYTETRRRHPLAGDRRVIDGIRLERYRVSPLRDRADLVIDTSALTPAELKRLLQGHFALDAAQGVSLFVRSFSYRHGIPRDADLVFDVRFLDNPHYVPELRPRTGLDPSVGAHIAADPGFAPFFDRLMQFLLPLLPRYDREGKSYLTIAIGCTGGRHRSVYVAERLAGALRLEGQSVEINHRDLERQPADPFFRIPADTAAEAASGTCQGPAMIGMP